jgi:trk system potassium uptake protein
MRVAIVGAGAVGRSIAGELLSNGHTVMLIEKDGRKVRTRAVPGAEWVQADACEVSSLEEAQLATCDVVVAATGDDKANLVVSLLAKTEFAVNRVVARVKDPRNEWLYTEAWGVDVAVSTPRVLAALVEEAVTVGDVVRLMSFRKGAANLVEITLAEDTPWVGKPLREVPLPRETVLTAVLRGDRVITPSPDEPLEAGDELLFVTHADVEEQLQQVLSPAASFGADPCRSLGGAAAQPAAASPGCRCRCSRDTTHRVTTTSTAVTGRPSSSEAVPSSSTSSAR